jgi:hypothetical protein
VARVVLKTSWTVVNTSVITARFLNKELKEIRRRTRFFFTENSFADGTGVRIFPTETNSWTPTHLYPSPQYELGTFTSFMMFKIISRCC